MMNQSLKNIFEKVSAAANNNLNQDMLVHWLKYAKVIDGKRITEDQVRDAFTQPTIGWSEFQAGVKKLSDKTTVPAEEITKKIAGSGEMSEAKSKTTILFGKIAALFGGGDKNSNK